MNFDDTPAEAELRAAARAWLAEHRFDLGGGKGLQEIFADVRRWQRLKHSGGWGCMTWPAEYGGREASAIDATIFAQEEAAAGMEPLALALAITMGMAAFTIMHCGTPAQKRRHLPRIAVGEEIWCQLFSEPAAGSDLAGIRTRAVHEGDHWRINGQKIWTSLAQQSDWAILVTRSDPEQPKHKGLTYFLLDMTSPGVEVRPIRQASGESEFNEVFLTDVRIPDENRVGEVGDGWRVALTTLMSERVVVSGAVGANFDLAWRLAQRTPLGEGRALDDAAVRGLLADWYVWASGLKSFGLRLQSALSRGQTPGPEASIGKLVLGARRQEFLAQAIDLLDMGGCTQASGDDWPLHFDFLRVIGNRLEGGTDEILRNIISERVLGLPPEPRIDKDVPFNQIERAGSRARQGESSAS